jgi:hypothetical protein
MLVLKLDDFYKQLNSDTLNTRTSKEVVKDSVKIKSGDISWDHRIIKNVVFEKEVLIEKVNLKCGLSFEFCEFKGGIVFNNVIVSEYNEDLFPINASLYFYECKASKIYLLNNSNLNRSIKIVNNSEVEKIIVSGSIIGNGGISIKESSVSNIIDIDNTSSYGISIYKSEIKGKVNLNGVNLNGLSFIESNFYNWLQFYNVEAESTGVVFNKNVFKETVTIESSRLKGLFIHNDEFLKEFKVIIKDINNDVKSFLSEIYIAEAKFINRFVLEGNKIIIEKVTLPITTTLEGVIKLDNCNVLETKLSGVNENLNLIFKRIGFKKLNINDFSNNSEVTFSNSFGLEESLLEIVDTDLGGTKFNDFSFKSFNKLKISNAFLNNIVCINITWFEDEQLDFSELYKGAFKVFRNKREIYRQIKQALKNSGNMIDSLNFKARELSAYDEELTVSKEKNCGDKIIMYISRTNNYGLSWLKPTRIIFRMTLIFYIIVFPIISDKLNYLPASNLEDIATTFCVFYEESGFFWQLFNPTRKFSDTYGGASGGFLYFLDFLHRIVLAIFIFQIIKGFRKFVAK